MKLVKKRMMNVMKTMPGPLRMRQHVLAVLTVSLVSCSICSAQDLLWTRQAGTSGYDKGHDVAVDGAGNAYITGYTQGSLGGPNAGGEDFFLAKYDVSGTLLWTRQAGTSGWDEATGVAVDGAGNAYITGETRGSLFGPNAGSVGSGDYFLAKYDASGVLLWSRQAGSAGREWATSVAVDIAGNAYITGSTWGSLGGPIAGGIDYFLAKYDASGVLLWTRQAGTRYDDKAYSVAVDRAGNAYIAGKTTGSLSGPNAGSPGGEDYFLAKYDASGTLLWTRQAGTSRWEYADSVDVDSAGNAYIAGWTDGSLARPHSSWDNDYFLAKYDASGTLLWTRQAGTAELDDGGYGMAVDSAGNAYITGFTFGSLGGPNAGKWDYFLAKYDASGTLRWTLQDGTAMRDSTASVAVDNAGNAYITGWTAGSLFGPLAGKYDLFLAKYDTAPCYADCDTSTGAGVLDVFDFLCFQDSFVNSEPYACDCDTSTGPLVCDVFDFLCFQNAFVGGCP